jgi:hypothetical protein
MGDGSDCSRGVARTPAGPFIWRPQKRIAPQTCKKKLQAEHHLGWPILSGFQSAVAFRVILLYCGQFEISEHMLPLRNIGEMEPLRAHTAYVFSYEIDLHQQKVGSPSQNKPYNYHGIECEPVAIDCSQKDQCWEMSLRIFSDPLQKSRRYKL